MISISNKSLAFLLILLAPCLSAEQIEQWDGRRIMEEVYQRHQQFPYIYEEQSMVLVDKNGYRDTRKLRRFSRVEEDGSVNFLLLFDYPREVQGLALLANRDTDGITHKSVYLPALGQQLFETSGSGADSNFLGSDFSIENLTGEVLDDYQYVRRQDKKIEDVVYLVIDVYHPGTDPQKTLPLRCHYVRRDNFYIVRTDHYDSQGRLTKQQSNHDLTQVDGDMWRANMILMVDMKEHHQSLIKIDKRVFSRDYVPAEIFSAEWLYKNHPFINEAELVDEENESENKQDPNITNSPLPVATNRQDYGN